MKQDELNRLRAQWVMEIQRLTKDRTRLDRKIVTLTQMIASLQYLEEDESDEKWKIYPPPFMPEDAESIRKLGLSDSVRAVLQKRVLPQPATEIRDVLDQLGCVLPEQNPLSAIHAVLRRLEAGGEVKAETTPEGKTVYSWLTTMERVLRKDNPDATTTVAVAGPHKPFFGRRRRTPLKEALDPSKLPPDIAAMVTKPKDEKK